MLEILGVILSAIVDAVLFLLKHLGNLIIKYFLPKSQQRKWETDSDGAFIIGAITFLILVALSWWLVIGLKS